MADPIINPDKRRINSEVDVYCLKVALIIIPHCFSYSEYIPGISENSREKKIPVQKMSRHFA